MLLGTQTSRPTEPVDITLSGLLHHTLVVGQSGSGKSYAVARLIEEILLRTRARILVVDPNGDFRHMYRVSEDVWSALPDRFASLSGIATRRGLSDVDTRTSFSESWAGRRFLFLAPGSPPATADTPTVLHRRLYAHWDRLDEEQREFLLYADPSLEPKALLGLDACRQNAEWVELNHPALEMGYDLRSMLEISERFANRDINLRRYPFAKNLTADDWYAVRAKISDVLKRYTIWSSRGGTAVRRLSLTDFIDGAFVGAQTAETYWDVMALALDAARPGDTLLSVDIALTRLWKRAKEAWRKRGGISGADPDSVDRRAPTFVVVDEAHNFAPDRSGGGLRQRVTDRLIQIASEGRKYGLYLVLATQRPTKLHRELVPECENTCVLRVQSEVETTFLTKVLGIPDADANMIPRFEQGQALMGGRWVGGGHPVTVMVAPARSTVGGGGLGTYWHDAPEPSPPFKHKAALRHFIEAYLQAAPAPVPFAELADVVSREFDAAGPGDWMGYTALRPLIESLSIPELTIEPKPPGYLYLRGQHEAPAVDSVPLFGWVDNDTQRESLLDAHRLIDLPSIKSEDYRMVLELLSEEVQHSEFSLTEVSKAVRDEVKSRGGSAARQPVNYVIKGISFSGHTFDPDLPQDPSTLAAAFAKTVQRNLENTGAFDRTAIARVVTYASGGLLPAVPDGDVEDGGSGDLGARADQGENTEADHEDSGESGTE